MAKSHIPSCQPNLSENSSGFLKLGSLPRYEQEAFEMRKRLVDSAASKKSPRESTLGQADATGAESNTSGAFNLDGLLKSEKDQVQYSQESFGDPSQNHSSIQEHDTPKMVPKKRKNPEGNEGNADIGSGWFTPK